MQIAIFVLALLAFVVAGGALLATLMSDEKGGPLATAVLAALVGGLLIFAAGANSVPQRNVGIVTSFNKATGETTGAGFHWVAPWKNIDDWDATRQAYDHRDERNCVQVRIADLSNACVEALIEWNTKADKAPEQWGSYKKDFNNYVSKRVDPNFAMAFNEAFANHDPLKNVDEKTGNLNVPYDQIMRDVRSRIEARIGSDVEVLSVVVSRINYDEKTQGSIDAYRQAVLKGRTLEKEHANALKQKAVSEVNAQVDKQTRCMDLAEKLGKEPGYCMWANGFPAAASK